MRFLMGMLLGVLLGSAGTYAALEKPWAGDSTAAALEPDAGVEIAQNDGKKRRKKKGKKRGDRVEIEVDGDQIPELSAADRESVWKGDAVALPTKQVDMASGDEGGPLSQSDINSVIQGQSERMLGCITEARGFAQLKSTIEAKMLVDGNGRVVKSRFRAPRYLFDHGFLACAKRAAGAMRFPASGGYTVVEAPYDLY